MGAKNPNPVTDDECVEALRRPEAIAKGGLSAREITDCINVARRQQNIAPAAKGAVMNHLQVMTSSSDPKVQVDRARSPFQYFLPSQEKGEVKLNDPVPTPEKPAENAGNGNGGNTQARPAAPPKPPMLRDNRTLYEEIWDLQGSYGYPRDKRKSRDELDRLTVDAGKEWLKEANKLRDENVKDLECRFQLRIDDAVSKALEGPLQRIADLERQCKDFGQIIVQMTDTVVGFQKFLDTLKKPAPPEESKEKSVVHEDDESEDLESWGQWQPLVVGAVIVLIAGLLYIISR